MELEIQYPKKIAAVFGGLYAEHDVSIFSFKNFYIDIQSAATDDEIELSSIYYIKRNGKVVVSSVDLIKPAEFYFNSECTTSYSLMDAFSMIKENNEFVYLICDGSIGIDGRFTSIAQNYALKGTFGSSLSFGICRSKFHLNQFVGTNYSDIKIPNTVYITCVEELEKAFTAFENQRIIVKPNSLGSSIYTMMFQCYKQNHGAIKDLVEKILEYDRWAIIQEYIQGEEYGCYCMEKDGTVDILATKQFEKKNAFLSTQDKYKVIEKSHDFFLKEEIPAISEFVRKVFKDIDCQNLSRMDFIITAEKEIYFLENNCNPALRGFIEAYKKKYDSCNAYHMLKIFIENEYNRHMLNTDYYLDINFL
ncbi:MAG: ATP-grasp domain-containing protein [Deltaproteobacteria bacterium]|uniref:ATP-grasp domain-containing protein n=1 Tax=Desulfobacula sp. TaxID=2593537 RepID=UPI0019B05ACA|nr:ATP-grasp domain-containing protein [Candidatus Desulfobacula maris]MBL6993068.1 ATP-grasp domain-containing protein [Desulfobacula sp.]